MTTTPAPSSGGFTVGPSRRRVQVPQLVVGVLVVALSALVAVVVFSQTSARVPVLVAAQSITRGTEVSADDVRVAYVGTDDILAVIAPEGLAGLVGLRAVIDVPEGTVLTRSLFTDPTGVGEGDGVVGLALSPGEYPTLGLAVGDRVDVVDTDTARVVATGAVVHDISELGGQGQRFVSLRLPAAEAVEVAVVAGGRLRLVLVGGDR